MEITIDNFRQLLIDAAELGAKKALIDSGLDRGYLKQSEAFRIYGRATVERWIKDGLIIPTKQGPGSSTVRLDKINLEILSKTSTK